MILKMQKIKLGYKIAILINDYLNAAYVIKVKTKPKIDNDNPIYVKVVSIVFSVSVTGSTVV